LGIDPAREVVEADTAVEDKDGDDIVVVFAVAVSGVEVEVEADEFLRAFP